MAGRRDFLKRGAGALGVVAIGSEAQTNKHESDAPGFGAPKHVVLIVLDRSGSMSGMKSAVVNSINQFLDEQKNKVGMFIGLVQFDNQKTKDDGYCEPIFSFSDARSTPRLAPNDYQPRGGTPLLAATVEAISKLEQVIRPEDRALMVLQTDGYENSSPSEITKEVVKQLMESKKQEGNFTFAFLGADIDAWATGGALGVAAGSTLQYVNSWQGTQTAWATTSASTSDWYNATAGGVADIHLRTLAPTNTNDTFYNLDQSKIDDIVQAVQDTTINEINKSTKKTRKKQNDPTHI